MIVLLRLATAFASQRINLEQYVAQVREANPNLKAFQLRASAQQERISPAATWDDPFFAVGPDEIPFSGGNGSVLRFQLSQSVPFPGKLGARKKAAELRADGAQADLETEKLFHFITGCTVTLTNSQSGQGYSSAMKEWRLTTTLFPFARSAPMT